MNEHTSTATLVKSDLPDFAGVAHLYRCVPPMRGYEQFEPKGAPAPEHEYVIASAANVMFSGPETYLFPATADGEVADWLELPGSCKGTLDHSVPFANVGYVVVGESK